MKRTGWLAQCLLSRGFQVLKLPDRLLSWSFNKHERSLIQGHNNKLPRENNQSRRNYLNDRRSICQFNLVFCMIPVDHFSTHDINTSENSSLNEGIHFNFQTLLGKEIKREPPWLPQTTYTLTHNSWKLCAHLSLKSLSTRFSYPIWGHIVENLALYKFQNSALLGVWYYIFFPLCSTMEAKIITSARFSMGKKVELIFFL